MIVTITLILIISFFSFSLRWLIHLFSFVQYPHLKKVFLTYNKFVLKFNEYEWKKDVRSIKTYYTEQGNVISSMIIIDDTIIVFDPFSYIMFLFNRYFNLLPKLTSKERLLFKKNKSNKY